MNEGKRPGVQQPGMTPRRARFAGRSWQRSRPGSRWLAEGARGILTPSPWAMGAALVCREPRERRRPAGRPDSGEARGGHAGSGGEVPRSAERIERPLTADVIACPDGGPALGNLKSQDTVVVPGTADIWLAGQPNGSMLPDGSGGGDTAPADSPVDVPVVGGGTLTLSASGGTSYTGGLCVGSSPDGGCTVLLSSQGPANGLSNLAAPMNALIGVFLDASFPAGQPPASFDASGSNDFATLVPLAASGLHRRWADGHGDRGRAALHRVGGGHATGSRVFRRRRRELQNTGQFNVTVSEF
jgi:hypothetical protein